MIEVKSSSRTPSRIVLSRAEWEAAVKYGNVYFFYIWRLPSQELMIRSVAEIETHIPKDSGEGIWVDVEIVMTQRFLHRSGH